MSVSLYAVDKKNGGVVAEFNYFRSPLGLAYWADDEVKYLERHSGKPRKEQRTVHYVCTHWSYGRSTRVNRRLFKEVIDEVQEVLQQVDRGRFWLDAAGLMQFVFPKQEHFPLVNDGLGIRKKIEGSVYHREKIGIPMEYFAKTLRLGREASLQGYLEWYGQLAKFAEALQDQSVRFECST